MRPEPDIKVLKRVFDSLFADSENTVLEYGAAEPFYQTWQSKQPAKVICREDYFSSALHEIAHWCIAGKERRKLDDFGYWYLPDGRDQQKQVEFERVEVNPQALEWALSLACGHQFHFSPDNLNGEGVISDSFKQKVYAQLGVYLDGQLPQRGQQLVANLGEAFGISLPLKLPGQNVLSNM